MVQYPSLALKVDVDTEKGTRLGVPNLLKLFAKFEIPATFLFSLGPDNTGRAIKRIFRPGFFKKVSRSSIISTYGFKTLLNGVLWPGPHIGHRNANLIYSVKQQGHEVGIHCYDHVRWQDSLARMSQDEVLTEFAKATDIFEKIFGESAKTAGAAGWQANAFSLSAYDQAHLLYGSDTRGTFPFFPAVKGQQFKTLQIPTTLPTLDELVGRPEYPMHSLLDHYFGLIDKEKPNIFTIHAEIEGMQHLEWFGMFLQNAMEGKVRFIKMEEVATQVLENPAMIPTCEMIAGEVDGRSGTLAMQGDRIIERFGC